jgi:hypothetical protein
VRFRLGRAEVIGGWESLTQTLLTGVCRMVFPWTENSDVLNIAFGTNSNVQIWQGGALYDVTPFGPPTPLPTDPLTTTNASAVVTVHQVAHGYTTGVSVKIFGSAAVGGITPVGTFAITVIDADHYSFTFTSSATSAATGGGSAIVVTPQTVLPPGPIDGTGSAGFGTGAFGVGPYGETSPTAAYFPATWDFAAWGQNLIGGPRGGGFYQWSNDTAQRMVAIDNAPTQITYHLVAPMNGGYMAFALGCNQEADGVFNPMTIRHSAVRTLTQWSTLASGSTAREYTLTGGGRIVSGRMIGPYLAIWTSDSLWLGTYTGALNEPWSFQRQGTKCGLIGPNAVIVVGQSAFWVSPDRQFHTYDLGGQPEVLDCPIRTDFADNLAASQGDKIVASSNAEFSEIRFDYPDNRDGYENSRYLAMCLASASYGGTYRGMLSSDSGAWHRGVMARTAFVDAGPSLYPIGVTFDGHAYFHEKGHSADGQPFAWFIRTAAQLLDVNWRMMVTGLWPDFLNQVGPITVTVTAREHPQGVDTPVSAAPMAPGDQKADFRISGRLFQVEFSGSSAPTEARIGKPVFNVEQAGKR